MGHIVCIFIIASGIFSFINADAMAQPMDAGLTPVEVGDGVIYKAESRSGSRETTGVTYFLSNRPPTMRNRSIPSRSLEDASRGFLLDNATQTIIAHIKRQVLKGFSATQLKQILHSGIPAIILTVTVGQHG